MTNKNELNAQFREARNWEADTLYRIAKSERRAWYVAGGASVIAISAVIALAALAPLKHAIPYVFAVDKSSGNVEMVSAGDDTQLVGYKELIDKHWAKEYVTAREGYFYKLLQHDYNKTLALSSDEVGQLYAKQYEGSNSRDKKLGSTVEYKVDVISVTVEEDAIGKKAVVRFSSTKRNVQALNSEAPNYYVATFSFEYKPSMFGRESDLIENPLGFKVTSYRVDAEIAPIQTTSTAAPF